jgi:hypothetical protein
MTVVQTIRDSGEVALGEEHAGRQVLIEEIERGVWVIKLGDYIPDSEQWLHEKKVGGKLQRAIEWAEQNPPEETDLDDLERQIEG